jgi:hypothetical protein
MRALFVRFLAVCWLPFASSFAFAHKSSDSYLQWRVDQAQHIVGHWDIALRDLDRVLDLDKNGDQTITWGELKTRLPEIASPFLAQQVALAVNGTPCQLEVSSQSLVEHSDGVYLRHALRSSCQLQRDAHVVVDYRFMKDIDPQHRGLLRLEDSTTSIQVVLDPTQPTRTIRGDDALPGSFTAFFQSGLQHIAAGADHVLFIALLVMGALLRQRATGSVWRSLFMVITAFSVAHSVTIALTALGLVRADANIIEPLIALTVLLTAIDTWRPFLPGPRWLLVSLFGFLHGFGFAGGLAPLSPEPDELIPSLLGFMLGVEAGQLLIAVAAYVVLTFFLRGHARAAWTTRLVCAPIAIVAAVWVVQRIYQGA